MADIADRIKGITVEIGGDTTGLNKALSGTNKSIRDTQTQLKDVERLLKLDPTNTELLRQKQELLAQSVGKTKEKLDTLKQAEKQVQEQFSQGKISQEQYNGLQREIVKTQQDLKGLEQQADSCSAAVAKVTTASGNLASASGKVSAAMAPATAAIVGLGAVAFNSASDLEESMNKVEVCFDDSADKVKAFAQTSLETYGIAKGTALDMTALYGDMATSMDIPTDKAAEMAISLTGLAGDMASFKNIGIDQAMTALNSVFTGETESLKTLGIVMTQTNLDAYALAEGYGKTTAQMNEAEKVQLRYAYVMDKTKNAQGDFARTSEGAANSTRVMQESLKEVSAEFGQQLLPVITPIIQKVTELIQWFSQLDTSQKNIILTVLALVAAISPVAGIISAISSAITFLTANPMVLLVAAIVALVLLIATKGEEIKGYFQQIDDFLQNVFAVDFTNIFGPVIGEALNAFFANLKNIWDAAFQIFNGVIDFIQGVFSGNWDQAWNGIVNIFSGIFNGITAIAKAPLNAVIGMINGAIGAINNMIGGLNDLRFTVPDWVPEIGGKSFGLNIPKIPTFPYLAKGGTVLSGSAIVGEAGPELLTVSASKTTVVPLSGSSGVRQVAGLTIQHLTVQGYSHTQGAVLARDLNRELGKLYK